MEEVSSVQFGLSGVSDSLQPHGLQHARPPCPSSISRSLFKLMSIESVMPSNHLILCHPLLLFPAVFPSIRIFSSELAFPIWWQKYWSFSFSISPSKKYSGLISFRIDWFALTFQRLLRVFSSITVQKHQFFSPQPSLWSSVHEYWKNHSFDYVNICQQSDVFAF